MVDMHDRTKLGASLMVFSFSYQLQVNRCDREKKSVSMQLKARQNNNDIAECLL